MTHICAIFFVKQCSQSLLAFKCQFGKERAFGKESVNSSDRSDLLYSNINEQLGLEFNQKKSQLSVEEAVWCGYVINTSKKTIALKQKRIEKMQMLVKQILENQFSTRRTYAKIMGCFWSARMIFFGLKVALNPSLFFCRKFSFCFNWFVEDCDLESDFYDQKVERNLLACNELERCLAIAVKEVGFEATRQGVLVYHSLGKEIICLTRPAILCFTDASDRSGGVGIYSFSAEPISFSFDFNNEEIENFSINLKEMMALIYGLLVSLETLKIQLKEKKTNSNIIQVFVDNNTAKSVAASKRVNLKSIELASLGKIFTALEEANGWAKIFIYRCPTLDNKWADKLSRGCAKAFNFQDFKTEFDLFSLCYGVGNSSLSYLLESVLKDGLWVPSMSKIGQ